MLRCPPYVGYIRASLKIVDPPQAYAAPPQQAAQIVQIDINTRAYICKQSYVRSVACAGSRSQRLLTARFRKPIRTGTHF